MHLRFAYDCSTRPCVCVPAAHPRASHIPGCDTRPDAHPTASQGRGQPILTDHGHADPLALRCADLASVVTGVTPADPRTISGCFSTRPPGARTELSQSHSSTSMPGGAASHMTSRAPFCSTTALGDVTLSYNSVFMPTGQMGRSQGPSQPPWTLQHCPPAAQGAPHPEATTLGPPASSPPQPVRGSRTPGSQEQQRRLARPRAPRPQHRAVRPWGLGSARSLGGLILSCPNPWHGPLQPHRAASPPHDPTGGQARQVPAGLGGGGQGRARH